jgi:hypothetical protein
MLKERAESFPRQPETQESLPQRRRHGAQRPVPRERRDQTTRRDRLSSIICNDESHEYERITLNLQAYWSRSYLDHVTVSTLAAKLGRKSRVFGTRSLPR